MVLWDRVLEEVARDYPEVQTRRLNVDAAAMYLINRPDTLDVVVCANLFGDILSDEAAALAGGIGLAPGGNINPERRFPSMFEPIHGSAPDIAGQGIANPLAAVLAGAMLLRFAGRDEPRVTRAANAIEQAVGTLLREGRVRTPDLGGHARTGEVGDAIAALIANSQQGEAR
jgi:tartrate dehydrogenase/decarboxylase/D-malate dehydrogenase